MKNIAVLILFTVFWASSSGQSFKAFVKAGDEAYAEKDFHAAMFHYENALKQKPGDAGVNFMYAEAARQFHAYDQAEKHYRAVLRSEQKDNYRFARYWLGMTYKQMGEYEKAIEQFNEYIAGGRESELIASAHSQIGECQWAMELAARPDPLVKIEKPSNRVNTAYSEFGALQRGDTLFYSSYRFEKKEDEHKPSRLISKVLFSVKGARGRVMPRSFNSDQMHTAHTAFSLDGRRIYFTICDYAKGAGIRCHIYYREKNRRNHWEERPVKLPASINMEGFTATHPNIGYDSTLQAEVLFFTSDRPGGAGGLDIWQSIIEEGGKIFSDPSNLAEINTSKDDLTPFFHTPSQTLFFSSDGFQGMGGYDIYRVRRGDPGGIPEHLGAPVNTSYNDVYFTLGEDGKSGFLSSNRPGSSYLDQNYKACCNDIYRVEWLELAVEEPVASSEGNDPPEGEEKSGEISGAEMPDRLEDFLPLALYFDNDEPDRRTRRTTTRKNYGDTFDKYYNRKQEYLLEYASPLGEEDRAEAEQRMEDFFENEVTKGFDFLFRFSEILLQRLNSGDQVEIFIKGFTSPRAESDYNLALGKRRISSLRNHFQTWQDGAFRPYLENRRLIITERSFGEETASAEISDDLFDLRSSVYSVGAARERRVEIVEIKERE
jgi:tetratricopeptide (TPR) repeat protein